MANRVPLIIDITDGNKIKELPTNDNIDMTGSGLANLTALSVSGQLSGNTLNSVADTTVGGTLGVTGISTLTGVTLAGNVTGANFNITGLTNLVATNISGSGVGITNVDADTLANQVGSYYLNYNNFTNTPTISAITTIYDIEDVSGGGTENDNDVLTWDAATALWKPAASAGGGGGGIALTDLSINLLAAQGNGNLVYDNTSGVFTFTPASIPTVLSAFTNDSLCIKLGDVSVTQNAASGTGSLLYEESTGVFTYVPPAVPTNVSGLVNDSNFVALTDVETAGYIKGTDVTSSGRITVAADTPSAGLIQIQFDESGLLTAEADTLETVVGRGASSSVAIEADAFNQSAASASTSTIKNISTETVVVLTSVTGTNYNLTTTNGNIAATNGNMNAANVSATTAMNTPLINVTGGAGTNGTVQNVNGDIIFETGGTNGRVRVEDGILRIGTSASLPSPLTNGDLVFDGNTLYMHTNDLGDGTAGRLIVAGGGGGLSDRGFIIPGHESGDEPTSPTEGEMIWHISDAAIKVWNGSAWQTI